LPAAAPLGARPLYQPFDVVIDLDETTFGRYIDPARSGDRPPTYILDGRGRIWRGLHGFSEALEVLDIFGARLSFFSAYHVPARNAQILAQITLSDGRTALQLAGRRLFSIDDVDYVDAVKRKDLTIVRPRRLARTILVDNEAENAFPGQEKNLLWLPTLNVTAFENADLPRFDLVAHLIGRQQFKAAKTYLEKIEREFLFDENKPVVMLGLIARALELSANAGVPLRQALFRLQWDGQSGAIAFDHEAYFANHAALAANLEVGVSLIRQYVNPQFTAASVLSGLSPRARFRRSQIIARTCQRVFGDSHF